MGSGGGRVDQQLAEGGDDKVDDLDPLLAPQAGIEALAVQPHQLLAEGALAGLPGTQQQHRLLRLLSPLLRPQLPVQFLLRRGVGAVR